MNRRTFLKAGAGTAMLLSSGFRLTSQPSQSDADLLSAAKDRIEKYRKADATLVVLDSDSKPVPGVKLKVEQVRHEFLFGCNFFMFGRCGSEADEETYRNRFAAVFNFCTLGFYWANYEAQRGQPNYAYTDSVVDWTRRQGIKCKGHPLVWDHPASSPRWLPEDSLEIDRLSKERVRAIVTRFKDRIDIWDVVNEAAHLPDKVNNTTMARWALAKGPVPYVREHLEVARAANPNALLVVNDYRTDPPFFRLLEELRKSPAPLFDAVGIQSHMHGGLWPLPKVSEVCNTYARLGLPLHFTETTVVSGPRKGPGENWGETTPDLEAKQADDTEKFYRLVFSQPAVRALTWWDFADRGAWQRAAAGWLRRDLSTKPVYERMVGLINGEWRTRTEGATNAAGELALRGFCGAYKTTAEFLDGRRLVKEFAIESGRQNRIELRVS